MDQAVSKGKGKKPPPAAPAAPPAPEPNGDGEHLEQVDAAAAAAPPLIEELTDINALDFSADEAELGAEGTEWAWYLVRLTTGAGGRGQRYDETCGRYPLGSLDAEQIRDEWGPGRYCAILRAPDGSIRRRRYFRLAMPRGWKDPREATAAAAAPVPGAPGAVDLAQLLRELDERQQRFFERMLGALKPAESSATQMLDLAERMATRLAGPKRNELDDFLKYMNLFDKFRGGGAEGTDWQGVLVREGIEVVRPLAQLAAARLGGAPGAQHALPGTTPPRAPAPASSPPGQQTNTAPPAPAVEKNPMIELVTWLQHQVVFLTPKARAGSSASLYAEVLVDNLPDGVSDDMIVHALKQPNALDRLFSILPNEARVEAQACRAWFEELLRELLAILEEPAGETVTGAGDTKGKSGDTPAA